MRYYHRLAAGSLGRGTIEIEKACTIMASSPLAFQSLGSPEQHKDMARVFGVRDQCQWDLAKFLKIQDVSLMLAISLKTSTFSQN